MPKLMNTDDTTVAQTVSNFAYSGKKPDALGGSLYTLFDLSLDVSGTISPFQSDLEKAVQTVVESLEGVSTSNSILMRVETFASVLNEIHGFLPFKDIDKSAYKFTTGGGTALNDGALSGLEAMEGYSVQLDAFDFQMNGVLVQITDGAENSSRTARSASAIKKKIEKLRSSEKLESLKTILVGLGDPDVEVWGTGETFGVIFERYGKEAGFDQVELLKNVTAASLRDLAGFISRSVSSTSQHLGTGGPSKNLTF